MTIIKFSKKRHYYILSNMIHYSID